MPKSEFRLSLLRPVTISIGRGSNTYHSLILRRPTELEFARAAGREPGLDAGICLLALVAGVPEEVIERLNARDIYAACTFMKQFSEEANGE